MSMSEWKPVLAHAASVFAQVSPPEQIAIAVGGALIVTFVAEGLIANFRPRRAGASQTAPYAPPARAVHAAIPATMPPDRAQGAHVTIHGRQWQGPHRMAENRRLHSITLRATRTVVPAGRSAPNESAD